MSENIETKKKLTERVSEFFRSTKGEFKKIVWPSKKTIFRNTGVVILFCIIIGVIVLALDLLFSWVFSLVVGLL